MKQIARGCGMLLLAVLILGGGGWWYYRENEVQGHHRRGPLEREAATLYAAIQAGDTQTADRILTEQPKLLYARFGSDGTVLHVASRYNRPNVVKLLTGWGADVSDTNGRSGATPLHWAALWGAKDAAAELIKAGAAVDSRASMGTPLRWAVRSATFHHNPRADYRGLVSLLLDCGADPNGGDGAGWPASLAQENPGIAALLKDRGAKLASPPPDAGDDDDPAAMAGTRAGQ